MGPRGDSAGGQTSKSVPAEKERELRGDSTGGPWGGRGESGNSEGNVQGTCGGRGTIGGLRGDCTEEPCGGRGALGGLRGDCTEGYVER